MIDHPASAANRLIREVQDDLNITIPLSEPIAPVVTQGDHDAIVVGISRVTLDRWKRETLIFRFQFTELGPANGIYLPAYVNLSSASKTKSSKGLSPYSKLGRWWRVILAFDPDLGRKAVSLTAFKKYLLRVRVVNVCEDNRQQDIPEDGQAQIVSEIVSVVARRSDQ